MIPYNIRRILVATDLSERSDEAELMAKQIARCFNASVDLVYGIEPISGLSEDQEDQSMLEQFYQDCKAQAEQKGIERVKAYLENGIDAALHIMVGPRWHVVLQSAEDFNADLIVIGRRTFKYGDKVVFGTTSQRVFYGSSKPILFVPGDDADFLPDTPGA